MTSGKVSVCIIPFMVGLSACSSLPVDDPTKENTLTHNIYIVNHAWHTGIVIALADLPPGKIPEAEDFPDAVYLEFGWGDREYYPARDASIRRALIAGLVPTESVIQIAGLPRAPDVFYPTTGVYRLETDTAGFTRMINAVDAVFDRSGHRRSQTYQIGSAGLRHYYPAHGRFHLFNTCNTWTARKLAAAGVPVSVTGVVTAKQLMRQLQSAAPNTE